MNQLQQIAAFREVLADYSPSATAKKLLEQMKLVLLVGPTSSGKNTIIRELLASGKYHFIVSDTTRLPRDNNGIMEQKGIEYWFRTEVDMLNDLQNGEFLEAAIIHEQQVSGISMRELAMAAEKGLVAINEIEVNGSEVIHTAKPDTLFLFILPPSFDEWLARMNARGVLPAAEVTRRISTAADEIRTALSSDFYTFIVNDTFRQTTQKIDGLVHGTSLADSQATSRLVAETLLRNIETSLAAKP